MLLVCSVQIHTVEARDGERHHELYEAEDAVRDI